MESSDRHKFIADISANDPVKHSLRRRLWQGCPTIARTPSGKLLTGWYTGGSREPSLLNYNVLVESHDGGLTWNQQPLLVISGHPEAKIQALDIQLWLNPKNHLWLFWVQRNYQVKPRENGHLNTWAVVCSNPDAEKLAWSEPIFIGDGFLRCQPTVLSDGRWLLCAYNWLTEYYTYYESRDQGNLFMRKQAGRKLSNTFDETMILERQDSSLWMLARTEGIGFLAECVSRDGGQTWEDTSASNIVTPSSRFFLKRLLSGRVLLVNNCSSVARNKMTALLSEDDGKTWPYSLLLDSRLTSYPDVVLGDNGELFVVYDRGRASAKEILISRVTEEDILAGELRDYDSYLGNIISKAPKIPDLPASEIEQMQFDDSELLKLLE